MKSDFLAGSQLQDDLLKLREAIGHSPDVVFRSFHLGDGREVALVYVDGLVDKAAVQEQVIKPLLEHGEAFNHNEVFVKTVISLAEVKKAQPLEDCILEILSGNTVLLVEGEEVPLVLGTAGNKGRSIDEPVAEAVIRGPHDGFIEVLSMNITLLRRRIKDPNFTMIPYKIGRRSQTDLMVAYIRGLTNEDLVNEVRRRIEQIDIDEILESGHIEQLIQDNYLSFFPQMLSTERPDRVVSDLMEGRVAILTDGTPIALVAPATFQMFMNAPDDYYERWSPGSLIRLLRYIAGFIALFLPSIYIALISYNHGLIPTKLVISIAAGREGVPFPSLIEAPLMEITIEILREAGLRSPKPIGQAVSIVGGLVIGQAAVQAGIVSPIMVIVVALTAMSSFTFAQYQIGLAVRILRFLSMMSAAVFGIYGIILFVIFITVHVVKLSRLRRSIYGPFGPVEPRDWKDTLIRSPLRFMKLRPQMNKVRNERRQR
ncbi:spore germination protein [Paenibacillus sp. P26]|nr:spore germination protein [Paenibacillus sp. P26]